MKKITLLFFMSLLSWCGYSQLALEQFSGTSLPTDWQKANPAGATYEWQVVAHSLPQTPAYGDTGFAAYLQRENMPTGQTSEDWLITKPFNSPVNGELHFLSRLTQVGDNGSTYRIMITTDVNNWNNLSAYTEVVPVMSELQLNPPPFETEYIEKVIPMPLGSFGQQVRIAFVMNGDNGDRWLIDNVSVVADCLDPTNLSVSSVGLNTATLNWTNNNPGANSWLIDIVPQMSAPTGTGIPYTGLPPYTATTDSAGNPLEQNTDYKFYVKAICTDGGYTGWIGPVNFSTVALGEGCGAPIVIPALPFSDTDNTSVYGDTVDGSPGSSGCGSTNQYLNGNDVFYTYTATANGVISINVTGNGAYSGIFVYTSCTNVGVNCAGGATTGSTPAPLSIPTFSVTAGQTYYFVISTWADPQTTPYTLVIQQVNCAPPVGLPTTNIGLTSADLSWTNPSSATSWQVVVQDPGDGIPQGAGLTVGTNTNYHVTAEYDGTPLTSSTPYEYYVRADCGNGTFSAWAGPYLFNTTLCEAADQCTYTFVMTDLGFGWEGNTMTVSQNGITLATIGSTFTSGVGPVLVTVPVCSDLPLSLFWNTGGSFSGEVGVAIQNNFGQTIYNKPPGTGAQGTVLYTDIIDCDVPECLPPGGLTVTNISTESVSLGWAGPATGNWDYYVVPAGSPAPTSSTEGTNTTTNPVNVTTGLVAGTNYQFYVRVVCDDETNSTWAGPFAFTTAVCPIAEQCIYTFRMTDSWGDGWNGNTMTITQNGATVATIGSTFTTGAGPVNVSVAMCHDEPFQLNWNSGGGFPGEVGIAIINSFSQTIYSKPPGTGSQNSVLFTGTIDCLNPECLAPTGLTAYDFTVDSAMLEWDGEETGNWEVFIVPSGDPAPTASSTGIVTTTNPVEVALPTPATNYDYYVRMICSDTESSEWAGPHEFHSMVCEPEEQCNYVFELTDEFGSGWGNFTMTVFQAGVPIATIGEDFDWGMETMTVEIPMCPDESIEVFWNNDGFAWEQEQVGLTIYTPFAEDVYVKEFGEGTPGTILFTGEADCTPPPCPKPQDLFVDAVGLDTADLHWTEMGDATNWEVYLVPLNSPEPLPTDSGIATTDMPYTATETLDGDDLESGTAYEFYVRAICGGDDGNSSWSGPIRFITLIENDDCADATVVEVNPGLDCDVFETGTITGSTGSTQSQSCITWMDIEYDVWYSFVAVTNTHAVNINEQVGAFFQTVIYEGDDCGALTQLACGDDSETVTNLTPGETYYVRVFTTYLPDPTDLTSFEICINTPPPPISVTQDEFTLEELVKDVLIGSECAQITNIQSSTGTNYGLSDNGIGYFNHNDSEFPMEDGIILVSGEAMNAVGPNDFPAGWGSGAGWEGDTDLEEIVGLAPGNSNDATWISFDFVTLTDELNFNFLFASEEYDQATFECTYSDSFAFILTDNENPSAPPINLAVLPSTTIPIQVTNIHPFNGFCPAVNELYFDQYNDSPFDPINFNGNTVILNASSPVLANHSYNIKLVIANAGDHSHNSAVFLEAGSFDIGQPQLGDPHLEAEGSAICAGESILLDTHLDNPEDFEYQWFFNDGLIVGEEGPTYLATEEGEYKVITTYIGASIECSEEGVIMVEFYDPVEEQTNAPLDLTACNASGFEEFDLTENTATMLDGIANNGDYTIRYYLTEQDAVEGNTAAAITNPEAYTNIVQNEQTIWVGIDVANSATNICHGATSFTINVQDLTPEFTITPEFAICEGAEGTITVDGTNYDDADVTFTWTKDGQPYAGTTNEITVTEGGDYEVTINNSGCEATGLTVVAVIPVPEADQPDDVTACNSYVLPALSPFNNYYTGVDGTGTMLSAGEVITSTQEIHVLANTGTTPDCTDDNVFTVTIVPGPVAVTPGDQSACDTYTLPELAEGNYFTASGGTGTMLNEGDAITTTQTIYVYLETGTTPNCTSEDSFVVTITPSPEADQPADVLACDSYVLPALSPNNNYYTGANGTGTMLAAGETITSTQEIHIFAQTGTTPDCTDDNMFTVTIVSPEVTTPGNQTACDSYTLPALTSGNYFTAAGGTGTMLSAGEEITSTQTIFVYAESGTTPNCTAEESFVVTVTPTPVADAPADVVSCDSYVLPSLGVGSYYTGPDGTGTMLAVGSSVSMSQTVYVYAQSGNCSDENSFDVTIIPTPQIAITEGCNEDNVYVLEAIFTDEIYNPENVTFAWTDASGASLGSGSSIIIGGPGVYNVTVTPNGDADCPVYGQITVIDTNCQVQRGISPNNDGLNDSFDLTALDVSKLGIFNRYGQEVYSFGNGYTDQWEGQGSSGEELPTGTYFYMIERNNGESRTGWVYINREN